MQKEVNISIKNESMPAISLVNGSEDYADVLQYFELKYAVIDYYLQVGPSSKVQGWIFHISAVISQIPGLFQIILPYLITENIPFKIPKNKETARLILDGYLNFSQIGKIISIYPENHTQIIDLAKKLITLTNPFKGPAVPTDIHLGGTVYTRYGSINPVIGMDAKGHQHKYIYDTRGQLIKDEYNIPFKLPSEIDWPFFELASIIIPTPKKILNQFYKITGTIKADARGNVYKGLYVKGLFKAASCIIKHGKQNMISDENGMDIHDRLLWQKELYEDLKDEIPLPKVIDLFKEQGDTYLVIEFINGRSLYERKLEINQDCKSWNQLTIEERLILLDYLLIIISTIKRLHERGYVHRDIQPANFLIDKNNKLYFIDIELAYSIIKAKPTIPFAFGTAGFMSPEQQLILTPTVKEDIYALGALMVELFTSLSPIKFFTKNNTSLANNLNFFIGNTGIAKIIAASLDPDPKFRPDINEIQEVLQEYKNHLHLTNKALTHKVENTKPFYYSFENIVKSALNGITKYPIPISGNLWLSKNPKNTSIVTEQKEYSPYPGLKEGIGGILYLISKANKSNFDITNCREGYRMGWHFIETYYLKALPDIAPGLYGGAAGIALSIAEGLKSGLLDNNESNRNSIQQCLSLPPSGISIAEGIAGQGISLLQCSPFLKEEFIQKRFHEIVETLLRNQLKDGSWIINSGANKAAKHLIGFGEGISGIIWFLLQYINIHKDESAEKATIKALKWIAKRTNNLQFLFNPQKFMSLIYDNELGDERTGCILCYIKAFEVFKDEYYKTSVINTLHLYPEFIVNNNFNQYAGLAGLGELYLEAYCVLKNEEWRKRAEWIAEVFINTFCQKSDDSGYWIMEENYIPTADFMVGISGIIHFLIRSLEPDKIGYRILN